MKKLLIAAVVIGIVATLFNDVGRYLIALGKLDSGTQHVALTASAAGIRDRSRTQPGGKAAVQAAQEKGLLLYGYQVQGKEIDVWTSITVDGTWVAGPFLAWRAGKPLDTPFTLTDHDRTFIR